MNLLREAFYLFVASHLKSFKVEALKRKIDSLKGNLILIM